MTVWLFLPLSLRCVIPSKTFSLCATFRLENSQCKSSHRAVTHPGNLCAEKLCSVNPLPLCLSTRPTCFSSAVDSRTFFWSTLVARRPCALHIFTKMGPMENKIEKSASVTQADGCRAGALTGQCDRHHIILNRERSCLLTTL